MGGGVFEQSAQLMGTSGLTVTMAMPMFQSAIQTEVGRPCLKGPFPFLFEALFLLLHPSKKIEPCLVLQQRSPWKPYFLSWDLPFPPACPPLLLTCTFLPSAPGQASGGFLCYCFFCYRPQCCRILLLVDRSTVHRSPRPEMFPPYKLPKLFDGEGGGTISGVKIHPTHIFF